MLDFQNSRRAVFSPGLDSRYFDGLSLADAPLENTSAYSQRNAWWLAELSRIIYRRSVGEDGMVLPDRVTLLANAGITEELPVSNGPTQASIVTAGGFHVVTFRGTQELEDWLRNAEVVPEKWDGGGKVHKGFKRALEEVWTPIEEKLRTLAGPLFFTGHSLGGAIAVLAAAKSTARPPLAVYTYGAPRCGDSTFAKRHPLRDRIYRIVNNRDIVPNVPPLFEHTGELRYITSDKRLLVNPSTTERLRDQLKDDDTHSLLRDLLPEQLTDHAPVNYVAWMQRFASEDWVRRFGGR